MAFYDIFNGDADGICALHQLRLVEPRQALLVTGVKRDIALLERVAASAGDLLTVLDVSLDVNRADLLRCLAAGARCEYFDHHYAGEIPAHPGLSSHIRYVAGTCTSLIVDDYLHGAQRSWAVVAAFGDNLANEARQAAKTLRLSGEALLCLQQLGECINYNAYGDALEDLHFDPAELYRRISRYPDPLDFARKDEAFSILREGYAADLAHGEAAPAQIDTAAVRLVILPDESWARRVSGTLANRLAQQAPQRAHAVLVRQFSGYSVSVRAPLSRPQGADVLCRAFAGGGGRPAAAGINLLPEDELPCFEAAFQRAFG